MKGKFRGAARLVYAVLAALLMLCIGLQFYWAGLAVFTNGTYWATHVQFVHVFGFTLPFIMLLTAIAAASTRTTYWHLFLLLLLTFLMYFSANMGATASWIGALHPVIGTMLLAVAVTNVWQAIKNYRQDVAAAKKAKKLEIDRVKERYDKPLQREYRDM